MEALHSGVWAFHMFRAQQNDDKNERGTNKSSSPWIKSRNVQI